MRKAAWFFPVVAVLAISAVAQDASHAVDMSAKSQSGQAMPGMGMPGMNMGEASSMPSFHASSGTSWQPASVPETMWMISPGGWDLMLHGTVFITYNQQGWARRRGQGGVDELLYVYGAASAGVGHAVCCGRCFRRSR